MLALWLMVAAASQLAATAVSSMQSGSQSAVWRPNKYVEQFRAECPGCNPLIAAGEPLCDVCASRFAVTALSSFGSGSLQESRSQRSANSHDPYAIAAEIPESPLNPNSAEFHPSPQSQATGGVQHLHNANEHHFAHSSQFAQRPQRRGQLHRGNVPRDLVPNWVLQMPTKWPSVEELHRYETPPPSYESLPTAVLSPPSDLPPYLNSVQIPTQQIFAHGSEELQRKKENTVVFKGTVDNTRIDAVFDSLLVDGTLDEPLAGALLRVQKTCVPQSYSFDHSDSGPNNDVFLDFSSESVALLFSELYTATFSADSCAVLRTAMISQTCAQWTLSNGVRLNKLRTDASVESNDAFVKLSRHQSEGFQECLQMLESVRVATPLPSDSKQMQATANGQFIEVKCNSRALAVFLAAVMAELQSEFGIEQIELSLRF